MRALYERFCAAAPSDFPLFMQPWYLDGVCTGATWDAAVVEKGGHIIAVWPYFLKKKAGMTYVAMPLLARMMGPYLLPEYRNSRHANGLLEDLLEQLPKLAAFEQDFNCTATNWLPMYWRGFRQTTRYTYQIDLSDMDRVWKSIRPTYRNKIIPRALERVKVVHEVETAEFLRVHNLSFSRQSLEAPISNAFFSNLDGILASRNARLMLGATDVETGALHSVVYLVWDQQRAYYLLAGDDPGLRNSGAGILLAWEAIRYAAEVLHLPIFDFAGSMVAPIERVRRQFGAQQQPYLRVWKAWSWAWKVKYWGR